MGIGQRRREGKRFLKELLRRYGVPLLQSETAIDQVAVRIVGMIAVEVVEETPGGETVLHRGVEDRSIVERPPIVGIVG